MVNHHDRDADSHILESIINDNGGAGGLGGWGAENPTSNRTSKKAKRGTHVLG